MKLGGASVLRPKAGKRIPVKPRRILARIGLVGALALGACERDASMPSEEPQPRPVKYVEVVTRGGVRTRTFTGFAKTATRSTFSFRVAGTVQRVHVVQGDLVEEGDLIAEMDPTDFEIQAREIEAALAEAQAREILGEAEFQRIQQLYEKDNASQGDFDSALAKRASARASVASVEQRLRQARRQLAHTRLLAPVGCGIIEVRADAGERVQAGTPVVEVVTGDKPQVEVAVPEGAISDIRPGATAKIRFSVISGRMFMGRVTAIGIVPSEGVTIYPVTIELDRSWRQLLEVSADSVLRPGMAVEAEMGVGDADSLAQVVPANAVVADRDGEFVYVVEAADGGTGKAARRPVETGRLVPEGLEVVAGLDDGDKVVTAGLNQIKDGQRVRLVDLD